MKVKGTVRFAYGEDRSKLPEDAIEVDVFVGPNGIVYFMPKREEDGVRLSKIETSWEDDTGLEILI